MLANYHTHTPRCNHAVGEEQCYVERAVEGGLKLLGFSDHTPYLFDKPGYYSSFRMRPEELDDYVQTLQKLRTKYADRIELHIGLEAEYYPKLFPRLLDFLRQYPVEYLILGQHALYNEVEGIYPAQPTTDRKLLDQYLGQTLDALDSFGKAPINAEKPYAILADHIRRNGLACEKLLYFADRLYKKNTILQIAHTAADGENQ